MSAEFDKTATTPPDKAAVAEPKEAFPYKPPTVSYTHLTLPTKRIV